MGSVGANKGTGSGTIKQLSTGSWSGKNKNGKRVVIEKVATKDLSSVALKDVGRSIGLTNSVIDGPTSKLEEAILKNSSGGNILYRVKRYNSGNKNVPRNMEGTPEYMKKKSSAMAYAKGWLRSNA